MSRCAPRGQNERLNAHAECAHGFDHHEAAGPAWWRQCFAWCSVGLVLLLLITTSLLLSGCQSGSYESGYRDGYAEGFTNGQDVGYRDGYSAGFFAARPPGDELSGAAAAWVKFGAAVGGIGLLLGLAYCVYALLAVDFTLDVAVAKFAAIAAALLLAVFTTSLIGAHRLAAPVLLSGRPASGAALMLIVVLTAAPAFLISAWLRSIVRSRWSKRQQITIVGALAFMFFFIIAVESLTIEAPQAERYLFCYVSLGVLLGITAHLTFRCVRKVEGW